MALSARGRASAIARRRDPIARLEASLRARNVPDAEISAIHTRVLQTVETARDAGLEAPWPEQSALLDYVYAQ